MNNLGAEKIQKIVDKNSEEEFSPMNPPDAFNPPNSQPILYDKLHPLIQELVDEHKLFDKILDKFEVALHNWKSENWIFNENINISFRNFFEFMDHTIPLHNQKEEREVFPFVKMLMKEKKEYNFVNPSYTGIDILEDEHLKVAQAAAIVFNFLGLGSQLPDEKSRNITFQVVFDQGRAIIETMKLHIYREENIIFSDANFYLQQKGNIK